MLKYIPSELLGRVSYRGSTYAVQKVVGVVALPPRDPRRGTDAWPTCIRPDMFDVRVQLSSGSYRHFGTERAFISADLRFVIDVNPQDEVLAKWEDYSNE